MCFCSGNFCNGPADVKRFYDNNRDVMTNVRPAVDKDYFYGERDYDEFYDFENETETVTDTTSAKSKAHNSHTGIESNFVQNENTRINSTNSVHFENKTKVDNNEVHLPIGSGIDLDDSKIRNGEFPPPKETEIDVLVLERYASSTDNSSLPGTGTSLYPVDINELSVGKLKDGSKRGVNAASRPDLSSLAHASFLYILFRFL